MNDRLSPTPRPPSSEQRLQTAAMPNWLVRLKPEWRLATLILAAVGVVLALVLIGAAWWLAIPAIWKWGVTDPLTQGGWELVKLLPAVFGAFFAATLPIGLSVWPMRLVALVLRSYAEETDTEVARRVEMLSVGQSAAEEKLERDDKSGLMPLVRYSRMQLEAYYSIGLTQTQRSFRYSVLAMWMGFVVILAGLVYQVLPLPRMLPAGIAVEKADIKFVALAGGTVVELIAALFLWVYRSSIQQLTYYYDRQMHIHNVLFCYRMAASTKLSDEIVRSIVDAVLKHTWQVERPAAPRGKVVAELFSKAESKPAS